LIIIVGQLEKALQKGINETGDCLILDQQNAVDYVDREGAQFGDGRVEEGQHFGHNQVHFVLAKPISRILTNFLQCSQCALDFQIIGKKI
jgi:hypothetical protein